MMIENAALELNDEFADFPESHWVGMKCLYAHKGVDRYMPAKLRCHDKEMCRIADIGYWKVDAGRFCCKVVFEWSSDKEGYWTTHAHLRALEKPKPKPPSIDGLLAKTNNSDDFERMNARLDEIIAYWNMLQKARMDKNARIGENGEV